LTDWSIAVFHEFLRHDPLLDVRQSPLIAQSPRDAQSVVGRQQQARPAGVVPLSTQNPPDGRLTSGIGRRTSPNCRGSAAAVGTRTTSDA